jgi:hypothetical protein
MEFERKFLAGSRSQLTKQRLLPSRNYVTVLNVQIPVQTASMHAAVDMHFQARTAFMATQLPAAPTMAGMQPVSGSSAAPSQCCDEDRIGRCTWQFLVCPTIHHKVGGVSNPTSSFEVSQ